MPGTVKININSLPYTLEPPRLTEIIANWILHHIGNRLVKSNSKGGISADLAKSWMVSPDGLKYIFYLGETIKFSDGTAMTSRHVVWALKQATKHVKGGNWTFFGDSITDITAASRQLGSVAALLSLTN